MRNNPTFIPKIDQILLDLDKSPSLELGIDLCNGILQLMGYKVSKSSIDVIDEGLIQLPNSERYDSWFQSHPWMGGERSVFEIADFEDSPLQAKFYWLNKQSRQFIAGSVHFTENWEDTDYTHDDNFKVGVDFFLSPNGKTIQVVLSNRGNLRIVELNRRLNNTQIEIFSKWEGISQLTSQEALHNTLWESFKLKAVNEKFYTEIANNFTLLTQHLKSIGKNEEESKLFASRLLGRLLFCWFLRKKGIIDETMGYFDVSILEATEYYRQSLEKLFFLTLNTPIDERDELNNNFQKELLHILSESKQSNIFKVDDKTPYLNGGLFEAHDNDWFNDVSLTFPNGFFVNLYKHFEEFNFTTDESTPEYEQVAIDPEMLGRVFESLLATQIDETGQQARKAMGAFYTPREIVSYMCKESLRDYLYNTVRSDQEDAKTSIDSMLDISDSEWAKSKSNNLRDKIKDYRTQIIEALDLVTVLDPACGSGAFPMGMLQLIVKTYERLEGRFDSHKTKLQIIQNNIFGSDIEPMAVEIARLRAWLSLIVDEEDSRNIEPLPNLDFKFICANSLVPLDKELGLFSDASLHEKLKDIRIRYFNARNPHTKKALQDEYHKLTISEQTSIITDDNRTKQLKSFDPFKNSQPADFFDQGHMFGVTEGFNIVIGNPPYINVFQLYKNKEFDKSVYNKLYESAHGAYDIYVLFFELALNQLSANGILAYITPNKYLSAEYAQALREILIKNMSLLNLIDVSKVSVFEAAVYPIVSIFQKGKQIPRPPMLGEGHREKGGLITIQAEPAVTITDSNGSIDWSALINQESEWMVRFNTLPRLTDYADISASFTVSDSYNIIEFVEEAKDEPLTGFKKLVISSNIHKHFVNWGERNVSYLKHRFKKPIIKSIDDLPISNNRKQSLKKPKIIIAGMTKRLRCFYDAKANYIPSIPTIIIHDFKTNPKYIVALLNSSFMDAYYRYKYDSLSLAGGYLRVGVPQLSTLPILVPGKEQEDKIVKLVDELDLLSSESERQRIISEIDILINEIYNLDAHEISIIEDRVHAE